MAKKFAGVVPANREVCLGSNPFERLLKNGLLYERHSKSVDFLEREDLHVFFVRVAQHDVLEVSKAYVTVKFAKGSLKDGNTLDLQCGEAGSSLDDASHDVIGHGLVVGTLVFSADTISRKSPEPSPSAFYENEVRGVLADDDGNYRIVRVLLSGQLHHEIPP